MAPLTTKLLLTCEHAGNEVPAEYSDQFRGWDELLQTHRGWDIGAKAAAENLAAHFGVPLLAWDTTRLLVDVNRSLWRRSLFSEITKPLPKARREHILERWYYTHRQLVTNTLAGLLADAHTRVLHLAVHSFTPLLYGKIRETDIGLLYDPARLWERRFCRDWQEHLNKDSEFRTRLNYPYRGKPDGLTAHFRKIYPDQRYAGIELEINQLYLSANHPQRQILLDRLKQTLDIALKNRSGI